MSSRIFSVSDTNLVFLSQAKLIFSALERFVQPGPGLVPLPTCVLPQGENQVIRLSAVNGLQDFLEVLSQLHSPNHVPHGISQIGKPFGLIQIPLKTASLDDLIERFAELSRAEAHIGVSPGAPSGDDPSLTLEQERYQLGLKVLDMDHAPLSQEVRQGKPSAELCSEHFQFLKRGCPHSLRGCVYAQVLGCQITEKDNVYYNELKEAVITVDIMLDKLIIKVHYL